MRRVYCSLLLTLLLLLSHLNQTAATSLSVCLSGYHIAVYSELETKSTLPLRRRRKGRGRGGFFERGLLKKEKEKSQRKLNYIGGSSKVNAKYFNIKMTNMRLIVMLRGNARGTFNW